MKDLSSLSSLPLQNGLDKSEKGIEELRFKTLNDLRGNLKSPIHLNMYYDLTKDLQFNSYTSLMRVSVLRKYK